MKLSKKRSLAAVMTLLMVCFIASSAFAALPSDTVIVGDKGYSFEYFKNSPEAILAVADAVEKGDPVYVKLGDGVILDAVSNALADESEMPALTYYDDEGNTTEYGPGGEEIVEGVTITAITATNGQVVVTLSGAPTAIPVIADFTLTQAIDAAAATALTPTAIAWDSNANKATFTVPTISSTGTEQSVVVTAKYLDGEAVAAEAFKVAAQQAALTVIPETLSFDLSSTSSRQLTATPTPADAAITYSSSDSNIATVSSTGYVTAVAVGTANITVTAAKTGYASKTVTVPVTVTDSTTKVVSVTAIDRSHIKVVFNNEVKRATAEDVTNYTINCPSGVTANTVLAANNASASLASDNKTLTIAFVTLQLANADYYFLIDGTATTQLKDANNIVVANSATLFAGKAGADATKPEVVRAAYNATTSQLQVVFSETMTTTSLVQTGFSITDGTTTVALDGNDIGSWSNNNQTLTITLTPTHAAAVAALTGSTTLAIAADKVSDAAGNGIAAVSGISLVPATYLVSSKYNEETNILELTFNRAVDLNTFNLGDFTLDGTATRVLAAGDVVVTTANAATVQIRIAQDAGLTAWENTALNKNIDLVVTTLKDTTGAAVSSTSNVAITYTEDTAAPTLVSAAWNATTSRLTLTFNEPIDISTIADGELTFSGFTGTFEVANFEVNGYKSVITAQIAGGTQPTSLTSVASEVPVAAPVATTLSIVANAFKDAAANGITAVSNMAISYTDATPPAINGALTQINPNAIKVAFTEAVDQTSAETVANYLIYKADNPAINIAVNSASLQSNKTDVILTLASNMVLGYQYTVKITAVKDLYGNAIPTTPGAAANITATTASDTTGPTLSSAVYSDVNGNYTVDAGDTLKLNFTEPVTIASDITVADFEMDNDGNGTVNSAEVAPITDSFGTGSAIAKGTTSNQVVVTLGTNPSFAKADLGPAKLQIRNKATARIKDAFGNSATLSGFSAINKPDVTAPVIASAAYTDFNSDGKVSANDYVTITYNESLDTTVAIATLVNGDFAFANNDSFGTGMTFEYAGANAVRVKLGTTPDLDGAAGAVSNYLSTATTINTAAGALLAPKDLWGNAAIVGTAVKITSTDTVKPKIASAQLIDNNTAGVSAGDYLILTMTEPVQVLAGIATTDFSLSGGGSLGAAGFAAAQGPTANQVKITLGASPGISLGATGINVKAGGLNFIRDAAGNIADQTTDWIVISGTAVAGDSTAPTATLPSATNATTNDADSLVVTFSESLYIAGTAVTNGQDVKASFTAAGGTLAITTALYDSTAKTVTFTLANAADTNTITHNTDATKLTDAAGNAYPAKIYTYNLAGTLWSSN